MRLCPKCGAKYGFDADACVRDGVPLIEAGRDPLIGTNVGNFQPLELVGMGGMAQVFRARHVTHGGRYALKVIANHAADDDVSRERFAREAKAIQEIEHPNVVSLIDFGTTTAGRRYLVMEWVDGRELNDAIKREAPFSPLRAAGIARQVAAGLAAIHGSGFVHRDVKPHNVMLFPDGADEAVKIVDFGLVYADPSLWERLTRCGDIVGTPYYMSPETIEGQEVDARTDLYSLGVILYEMLHGRPPFTSSMVPEILAMHLREDPEPLPDCRGLELLTMALLEKDPADRPQSAEEVMEQLDALDLETTGANLAGSQHPSDRRRTGRPPHKYPQLSMRTVITQPGLNALEQVNDEGMLVAEIETEFEASAVHQLRPPDNETNPKTPATRPALDKTENYPVPVATLILPPPQGPSPFARDQTPTAGGLPDLRGTRIPYVETAPYPSKVPAGSIVTGDLHDEVSVPELLATTVQDPNGALALGGLEREPSGIDAHTFVDRMVRETDPGRELDRTLEREVNLDLDRTGEVENTLERVVRSDLEQTAEREIPFDDSAHDTPALPLDALPREGPPVVPTVTVVPIPTSASSTPLSAASPSTTDRTDRTERKEISGTIPSASAQSGVPDTAATSGDKISPSKILPPAPVAQRQRAAATEPGRKRSSQGFSAAHFVLIGILLALVAAGTGLGYLVQTRDRTPRVVQVQLPDRAGTKQEGPRAIARQPALDPGPEETPAKKPSPAQSFGDLERELRKSVGDRGFALEDLPEVPGIAPHYADWLDAKRRGDPARGRAAIDQIGKTIGARSPDAAFLRKRSDELAGLLREARDDIPPPKLNALEQRYLELSDRLRSELDPEDARAVAKALRKLRTDIELARKSG